ncbi:MAG: hypothetical protein ACRDQ2_10905, partial [Gaiellales bacterium]
MTRLQDLRRYGLPKGLSTLRFDAGSFPPAPAACYGTSWQLLRSDSHRLADTSFGAGHTKRIPPFLQSVPASLGTLSGTYGNGSFA